jgi:hypothetical protein
LFASSRVIYFLHGCYGSWEAVIPNPELVLPSNPLALKFLGESIYSNLLSTGKSPNKLQKEAMV